MIGFGDLIKPGAAITKLTDYRLIKIDPQQDGFFDKVLSFKTENTKINYFINAVEEVKNEKIKAFYRPIYDPSDAEEDYMVTYQKGNKPALGHTYNWWIKTANNMPKVEGKKWHIATEYQYYAFLVWLINEMIQRGNSIDNVLEMVVLDSKKLGHYSDSTNSKEGKEFELTGSRMICSVVCDLANVHKLLTCSNTKSGGVWDASGVYTHKGDVDTLAYLHHNKWLDLNEFAFNYSVAFLVIY